MGLITALIVISTALNIYTLTVLYNWFAASFFGTEEITFWGMAGLWLLWSQFGNLVKAKDLDSPVVWL